MSERPVELQAILDEVRRRWMRTSLLRAATWGAAAAAAAGLAGWVATMVVARDGLPLVVVVAVVLLMAAFALGRSYWGSRGRPTDRQVARLIEERDGGLDDVLATAVEYASRHDASARMRAALLSDAARAVAVRGLDTDVDRVISRQSVRRVAVRAAAAVAALAVVAGGFAPSAGRAAKVASAYLFPARLTVIVSPGSARIRDGQPVTITARTSGFQGEVVPDLVVRIGDEERRVRMTPAAEPGSFLVAIDKVAASFTYHVTAAKTRSDDFAITVIRPPRVEQIDVHYEFPSALGLAPRTDEDSGDIYGPPGTRVRLSIAADKPITSAFLVLDDGNRVPLTAKGASLDGGLDISADGSYRIALADEDGLENPGEVEYFIRTLDDRPPDVRILRPASDKKVSALEEVAIEARADDDFGIASLDLVFESPDGRERTVPLAAGRTGLTAAGLHTLFMEDLKVQPGDFVTYYARARDVSHGRKSRESRSDIFFLEVTPFEEEFVAAQSQQMGQGGGPQGGLDSLIDAQKQIIVATWNLDARARRAQGAQSQKDIKAVAKSQADVRERAEQASAQSRRMSDPRIRRRTGQAPSDDPIGKAVDAMGRAVTQLDTMSTSAALPHEREALNQLLRAQAEDRRREVTRSQQAGGGGGQNRSEADLSSLFDQELRKRQSTNYETPNSTEQRQERASEEDPLDRIRDLARRQDALNRRQSELAKNRAQMEAEEVKRELERLTREQNELRQQAQELAQQTQQRTQNGAASAPSDQSQEGRRLREISEDMRNAAAGMQREDAAQAQQSGSRAADRLRSLEQQMQTSRPDERRRALGDMQLESRQLADEQRRLARESRGATQGASGNDARRRLAGEQERLADRAERLQENIQRLSRSGQAGQDEQRATADAARELERQKVGERMREVAGGLREGTSADAQQQELAKALDRVGDRLREAGGGRDAAAGRESDQLARTQELRDKLEQIERGLDQLKREGGQAAAQGTPTPSAQRGESPGEGQRPGQGQEPAAGSPSQDPQGQGAQARPSQAAGRPQQGQGQQSGGATGGGAGRLEQLQRDVNEQMREAERLAEGIRRENPGMQGANDTAWWRSFSAPGTEAFKQDFSRWESLKKHLLVALEDVETKLSDDLRARQNEQRLNAGGHETVSEAYRELVDKYYRSLAAPRRPQ